ncbi:MAG TPA: hypothetical protein VG077_07580 [Verrucomicrobiae bacterium]|nr:hypothetical protein [Verrucomicrobiae bacterium]
MKTRFRSFVCYNPLTTPLSRPAPARGWTRWRLIGLIILGLMPAGAAQALIYQGLTNSALGSATLALSGSSLMVSNLTSGGQDGVTIGLNAPGQFVLNTFYQAPANDGTLTFTSLGYIGGQPGQPVGRIIITYAGTNETCAYDFSPIGASTYTLEIFNGRQLVYQSHGNSGPAYTDFKLEPLPMDDTEMGHFDENGNYHPGTTTSTKVLALPMNVGGQIVTGDRVLAIPENPTNTVQALSGQSIQAGGGISNLLIAAESLTEGNVTLSALGNATLNVASSALYVSNLSSGGQDGVAIQDDHNISDGAAKGQASDLEIHMDPPDSGNTLPVGAYLQAQLVGTTGGISNGVLGTLTVTKAGTSNYVVSADFSPLGASSNLMEATRGKGSPPPRSHDLDVHSWSYGRSGSTALAQTTDFPLSFGFSYDPLTGNVSFSIDWGNGTTSVSGGGANVVCDQLYVTPQNVSLPGAPTGVQLVAAQVPGFTLTHENVNQPYAGLHFLSLGNAMLNLSSNQLTVGNFGTNSQVGCVIEDTKNISDGAAKGQASDVEFHLNPPDDGNTLPTGAYMAEQLIGTDNGVTNIVLGALTVTKAGTSNYVVAADFLPVGQSNFTVAAYSNGIEVASFQWGVGQGTTVAAAYNFPLSLGLKYDNTSNAASLSLDWGTNTINLSVQGRLVACDHLYITPDNVSLPGAPTGLQLVASQVPYFTITSVEVSPLLASVIQTSQDIWLQWYGTSDLQESADLGTWTDDTNATSPYAAAANKGGTTQAPAKFYRLVFRP